MLRRVGRATAAATDAPPIVAVGTTGRAETYRDVLDSATFVIDAPEPAGPVAGVRAAVDHATADWLFLCGCDMPDLAPSAIEWLFDRRAGVDAVLPQADGRRQPLHAWYRRGALERTLSTDLRHLRGLCDPLPETTVVDVEDAPEAAPLAASVRNVNTLDELERE
jgi:molybdopterin-guanine dinucleotide biosynthesis protein A